MEGGLLGKLRSMSTIYPVHYQTALVGGKENVQRPLMKTTTRSTILQFMTYMYIYLMASHSVILVGFPVGCYHTRNAHY